MKTTYLFDDELGCIPKEEWEQRNGKVPMRKKGYDQVMTDIDSFVSPIDKKVITSRPQLEAHNKEHGVTNLHDYSQEYYEKKGKQLAKQARGQTEKDTIERKQALDKTMTEMGV